MSTGSSPNPFSMQGSPGNKNGAKLKPARPPPTKQEDPQKCPLDPLMLFKINKVKQEPVSKLAIRK